MAEQAAAETPQSREHWRQRGHGAVCLWSELHQLQAEVLIWRATGPELRRPEDFLRDLTVRDPTRRRAWPEIATVEAWSLPVGPALAERCLAHRAGLEPEALRRSLLDLDDAPA